MNEQGFIVLYRQLLEWKYFMFSNAVTLWVYILLKANWKDGYFLGNEIPRGSFATSIAKMSADTGISESSIKRWLKRFEEDHQIERKSTNRCTIIKVSNYAGFQDLPDELVNQQMTDQVNYQADYQMTDQVNYQMNHNRTKKQSNKNNKETKKQIKDSLGAGSLGKNDFPDLKDVAAMVSKERLGVNPEKFFRYYEERNWMIDGEPVRDWKKLLRSWARNEIKEATAVKIPEPSYEETAPPDDEEQKKLIAQIRELQERFK